MTIMTVRWPQTTETRRKVMSTQAIVCFDLRVSFGSVHMQYAIITELLSLASNTVKEPWLSNAFLVWLCVCQLGQCLRFMSTSLRDGITAARRGIMQINCITRVHHHHTLVSLHHCQKNRNRPHWLTFRPFWNCVDWFKLVAKQRHWFRGQNVFSMERWKRAEPKSYFQETLCRLDKSRWMSRMRWQVEDMCTRRNEKRWNRNQWWMPRATWNLVVAIEVKNGELSGNWKRRNTKRRIARKNKRLSVNERLF